MKGVKKPLLIFIIILFSFTSTGCWNYRELDNMAIVSGLAIDRDLITKDYIMTVEVVDISSQGQITSIGSEIYTSRAKTMFDGIRDLIEVSGVRLFWAHCKVLIVSDAIARQGIVPVVDWVMRDSETRADMWLLISKGNSAGEILKNKVNINNITAFHISDIMSNAKIVYKFPEINIMEFYQEVEDENMSAAVGTIKNDKISDRMAPRVDGSAIFKGDKLVGYLDGNETMRMLIIKNKVHEGLIPIKDVCNSGTDVTLEIFDSKSKLKPIYKNGKITMKVDLSITVAIDEISGEEDFTLESKRVQLQQDVENKIKQNMQQLISKLQIDYDCDALGFQKILKQDNLKVFKQLKKSNADIFFSMQTEVNVHLSIKGTGETIKPIKIRK